VQHTSLIRSAIVIYEAWNQKLQYDKSVAKFLDKPTNTSRFSSAVANKFTLNSKSMIQVIDRLSNSTSTGRVVIHADARGQAQLLRPNPVHEIVQQHGPGAFLIVIRKLVVNHVAKVQQ